MTISDAAFLQFMRQRGAERVLLVEMDYAYEEAGAPNVGTLYFARGGYATGPLDTPASRSYRDAVLGSQFERSLDVAVLGGRAQVTPSPLKLGNADGSLDFMGDLVVDGHEVRFYLGAKRGTPGWTRADFRQVLVAVVERVEVTETEVTVQLRDKRKLLDREIKGDALGGSGPNATKYLPLLWGYALNIDLVPYLYDAVTLEYGVISNYAGAVGVSDVRDGGISLRSAAALWTSANTTCNAGTDVVTHVGHGLAVNDVLFFKTLALPLEQFAAQSVERPFPHAGSGVQLWVKTVPTVDTFTLSLTKGGATLDLTATTWNPDGASADLYMIRQRFYDSVPTNGRIELSAKSASRVTADVYSFSEIDGPDGLISAGDINQPFRLAAALIYGYGGIESSAEVDFAAAAASDTLLDTKVSTMPYMSLWVPERTNLGRVLDEWMEQIFGWCGDDSLGLISMGLLDISGLSAATPDHTLAEGEIDGLSYENLPPTIYDASFNVGPNRTVQTDLLASITDLARTRYGAPFQANLPSSTGSVGQTYAARPDLYHKTVTIGAPRDLSADGDIPSEPNIGFSSALPSEIVYDRRPNLRLFRAPVGIDKYDWKLGECVELTHSRFGLEDGLNCRIVGLSTDLVEEVIEMQLLGYVAPDVSNESRA